MKKLKEGGFMSVEEIQKVSIEKLDPNPFQVRVEYPEAELRDLGRSIRDKGLLEPIILRPKRDRYEICVGERRVRACRLVGIREIPAEVRALSDEEMAEYSLVENLHRRNLNSIEEARGFKVLQERFGWTQEKIANELGRGLTRDIVAQKLRLLTFPPELQDLVSRDTITPTHAEALARLADDPSILKETITKVVDQKLTTKQTEQLVEEAMKTQSLRERIHEYVTSEQFILDLHYFFNTINSESREYCPRIDCAGPVVYDESNDTQRMVCKTCGWEYGVDHGPLWNLLERIEELRKAKKERSTS